MLKKSVLLGIIALLFVSLLAGCNSTSKNDAVQENAQRPIMIQGPMPIEAGKFEQKLENVKEEYSNGSEI